ncbi:bifunctional non-homologous end joining protein LigD [Motilibacter peucedani]|uniref:DNA ligase (ATP) n=1 Tax=Motilibacter peucedani TaxID=598650 RepID=A0A420XRK5_9ACTN|nr:non-homologous end-joining DNA ligase [Motilibacter peucedani]RKS77441.1 bifunctional non-homologous end joining protein LigD [Motilibacter peucedani]
MTPERIRPMLASPGRLPSPADDAQWGYEMKWDGVRAIVYAGAGRLSVLSRNDLEVSGAYPELAGLASLPDQVVLDGEIVGFDAAGTVSFAALQQRMHVRGAAAVRAAAAKVPVSLLVFDLLVRGGESLLDLPYAERRRRLEDLELRSGHWDVPPALDGLTGEQALEISRAQELEGVMAKRLSSVYEPGRRSADWVKVKNFATQEVVIGGWKAGSGRRTGMIGSLLLGVHDADGRLLYVGNVGTGFTGAVLDQLLSVLRPLVVARPAFGEQLPTAAVRDVTWVRPELVGEVEFGNWTPDHRLRHPSWRGLRPDKAPAQVRVEAQG